MKLLFLVKYFQPYDRGGSEWSTENMARLMAEKGHEVKIITPNYGKGKVHSKFAGYDVLRMPFPIKPKDAKGSIAPYWTYNVFWFFYSSLYVLYVSLRSNYEVIHVQNNEFIPAGVIAAFLRGTRSVITFRDYQALCPLSFCFWSKKKSCNIDTFNKDIKFFLDHYTTNSLKTRVFIHIAAYRAFFISKLVKFIAGFADAKIAVSQSVADIYKVNGIMDIKVIENAVIVPRITAKAKRTESIIYIGKLSPGKGVDILTQSLGDVLKKVKNVSFIFIGSGMFKQKVEDFVRQNDLSSRVQLVGQKSHEEALKMIQRSKLVVVPSTWPEPLPRSLIETLLLQTPVVATQVGGIPEVLLQRYGKLVPAKDSKALARAIISVYSNFNMYLKNLQQDSDKLQDRFSRATVAKYEKAYQG